MSAGRDTPPSWPLDKRVPVALVLSLLLQTAGAIWWAATINHRVSELERDMTTLLHNDKQRVEDVRHISEYVARLDERMAQVVVTLREVRDGLKERRSQ